MLSNMCFFFFQAEDGIRDYKVTGVQTCALPICPRRRPLQASASRRGQDRAARARAEDRARVLRLRGRQARGLRDRQGARAAPAAQAEALVTYFRAVDPFPLESADYTKLHEFYSRLAAVRP